MDKTKPGSSPEGQRKEFSRQFKLDAVARMKQGGSVAALATELGVRRNQLYKWAEEIERKGADKAFMLSVGRPPLAQLDELTRLRRENARLEMENAILKKADAYFAKRKP